MITVEQIKSRLNLRPHLRPHPSEGGYFAETYRCSDCLTGSHLSGRYDGSRSLGTAIYYLLTPETFSAMHRLKTDEIFHFYLGDPVEMLQLHADGSGKVVTLGADIMSGMQPQVVVPRGVWQGARLRPGGKFALLGTTMAPGFEFADYETGKRDLLAGAFPAFRDLIVSLTPEQGRLPGGCP